MADSHGASSSAPFSASSTGQPGTASAGLDCHFALNRSEYEAMCRSVGIQPGWRVLDAGCGPGGFLLTIADLVGPSGSINAIDLAPDNVAVAEARLREWAIPCPVEVRTGSVTALPYPDGAFDAVWCANTVMYLSDEELALALAEFRRVVRSGGLIAVKEPEVTLDCILPGDPFLFARYRAARARASGQARQGSRGRSLYRWLGEAGLAEVRQRLVPIERFAPFDATLLEGLRHIMPNRADESAGYPDLSEGDKATWRLLGDLDHPENPLNDPAAYHCEGNVLAVGQVP